MDKEKVINWICLIAITVFIFYHFSPLQLFNNFTPTGGDYGSHIILADYAKAHLFDGKLIGLYSGWMAGMPMFQFYFPLPYMLIALLSYILPMNIAFKVVSVLGIFFLPYAVYYTMKLLKFKFPVPIVAAIGSLFLLFDGTFSVWGGNIKSTLAGQFSHSISLTLTMLFLGTLYYGVREKKFEALNGILLAAILLSHLYTFIIAVFIAGINFLLILGRKDWDEIFYLLRVGLLGFLLTGFWTIPFIAKLAWSQAPNDIWYGTRLFSLIFKENFLIFYVFLLFALFFYSYMTYLNITNKKKKVLDSEIIAFFYLFITLAVIFVFTIIISQSRLLNIRFIPFINLMVFMIAGIGLVRLIFWKNVRTYIPLVLLIVTLVICAFPGQGIKSWVNWNYEGIENKEKYDMFYGVVNYLAHDDFSGRIQFEYSKDYNNMGTPRVFESSPRYHGKPVIEALLLESCLTFPYHYYMEKEMSEEAWWPGFNITEPGNNLDKGIQDLGLFNVKRFVAYTSHIKGLIEEEDPDMVKLHEEGKFIVFGINEDSEYVEVLEKEPVLVITDDWRQKSYDWFDDREDVFLIYSDDPKDASSGRFTQVYDEKNPENSLEYMYENAKRTDECNVDFDINQNQDRINIDTDCIGIPLLVKFTYYPNWKVKGADKIYLASPDLMVIYPDQENVVLYYGKTSADKFGFGLTVLGIIMLIYLVLQNFLIRWKK